MQSEYYVGASILSERMLAMLYVENIISRIFSLKLAASTIKIHVSVVASIVENSF